MNLLILSSTDDNSWLTDYLFVIALGPGILFFLYYVLKSKIRERRFLPNSKGKSSVAFLNAYICSAVLMIKLDRRDADLKRRILDGKIRELNGQTTDLWDTFDKIWENEINEKRIAKWCVKNLSETERSDLMYMLVEFALIDGSLLKREHDFLLAFMQRLRLPVNELKSMLASHWQRIRREEGQRQQRTREQRKTYQKSNAPSKSSREMALEILGVSKNADESAIKKAYRSLVKKYHPDMFVNKDEVVLKAAKARFIEIQEAYETVSS